MDNKEIIDRLELIEKRLDVLENNKQAVTSNSFEKKVSIKEFIIKKNPRNDVQKTLCIAFYLEKYENRERFTSKEVADFFKKSKLSPPENVPDKVQKAIGHGWLTQDKLGEFYVTLTGEKIVEEGFDKNGKSR